jgi:hypothetical protein
MNGLTGVCTYASCPKSGTSGMLHYGVLYVVEYIENNNLDFVIYLHTFTSHLVWSLCSSIARCFRKCKAKF